MLVASFPVLPAILTVLNLSTSAPVSAVENQTADFAADKRLESADAGDAAIAAGSISDAKKASISTASPEETEALDPSTESATDLARVATVFTGDTDDQTVSRVVDYLEGLTTMKGEFVQNAPSGAISTGEFWLRRPGQIRFEYDDPTPLMIVATQGNVYVEDKSVDQTDLYPIKQTPLRFLLSKKIDLNDVNVRAVERGVDSIAVTFSAKEADETDGDLSIVLSAPDLALKQWVIRDAQNGVTVVTLKNVESGVTLANSLFRAPEAGGAFINN